MLYPHRPHKVVDLASVQEMARKLSRTTWTGCTGFRAGSLTALNDSSGPDGAQEYAIVRDKVQIESLTVSWMTLDELTKTLVDLDRNGGGVPGGKIALMDHPPGSCVHCA